MSPKYDNGGPEIRYRQWRMRGQQPPNAAPSDPWWTRPDNPQPDDPWWLRHQNRREWRQEWRRQRHAQHGNHPKLFVAIFLICAGAVLFLDNLGLFVVRDVWAFWPLILVAIGISRAASAPGVVARFSGAILILLGLVFLANNFGFGRIGDVGAWPLLLIAGGAAILFKTLETHRSQPSGSAGTVNQPPKVQPGFSDHNSLKEWVVFGNTKKQINSLDFRGGEVLSVFGEIKVDLSHAQIAAPANRAVIDANANFGSVHIRVPENWRVSVRGAGIFGGYEDKTIPPRPQPGFEPPLLVITGAAVFGAVVIDN